MALAERFAALEPRERRLLLALGVVGVAMFLLAIPFSVSSLLGEKVERNARLREAIEQLETRGPVVLQRRAELDALLARYEDPVPPLAAFLDKAATQSDIEIPELKDGPPIARGKKYEERSTSITIRQVGLVPLVKFMEKVSGGEQPISISKLNIRKRTNRPDEYEVRMTVSAYDRLGSGSASAEESP